MTTDPTPPKRTRRTDDEIDAALHAKLAARAAKRREMLKSHIAKTVRDLEVIVESKIDVGPIRDECKGLAVRLRSWA